MDTDASGKSPLGALEEKEYTPQGKLAITAKKFMVIGEDVEYYFTPKMLMISRSVQKKQEQSA